MAGADAGTNESGSAVLARHASAERMRQRSGKRAHDDLPFGHGCGARWSGLATTHCARCHQTFSGVSGFDQHRENGRCLGPAEAGLSLLAGKAYPCWGMPHTEPETPDSGGEI